MDKFYDYLSMKHFVDYNNEEIQDIKKAMGIFLKQLRDTFNELSGVLKIESLVPCGSMEEGTTVWGEENTVVEYDPDTSIRSIKFDCLAVLKPIVPNMKLVDACPGYKRIKSETLSKIIQEKERVEESQAYQTAASDHTISAMDKIRFLLTSNSDTGSDSSESEAEEDMVSSFDSLLSQEIEKKIKSGQNVSFYEEVLRLHKFANGSCKSFSINFAMAVDSAVEELCKTGGAQSNIDGEMNVYQVEMPTGILEYGRCLPGCQLSLSWRSKIELSSAMIIYADFVPAFQVPQEETFHDGDPPNFIVAKRCRNQDCNAGCWRWSHCLAEIKSIQTTAQHHRDVYKYLKIFNYSILSRRVDNALKSYHVKTALLDHIKKCTTESTDTTDCLCQVLATLNTYITNGEVPHWRNQNYSLFLKQNTCHRIVPMILQFVFDVAVKHSPMKLYLTIRCQVGTGHEVQFYKAGSRLSQLVCQIIDGKGCYESLETEIENTFTNAADLSPIFHHPLSYSLLVEQTDSPPDSVIMYQRCMPL